MNSERDFKGDILKKYINPLKREEAPEGFTSRVMSRVSAEKIPVKNLLWKKNRVPVISLAIVILLVAIAILLPGESDANNNPVMNIFRSLDLRFSQTALSSVFRINLPSIITYTIIGIVCLSLFDKALSGIFRKNQKSEIR
jgi:hypothetical protein